MNVLVTGGSGFLGRHLVPRLVGLGHKVRVLDVSDAGWRDPKVEFIASSVADESTLNLAVAGCDAIVHLASSVIPKTSNDDPLLDARTNLVGTLKLLDAGLNAGVSRVIYASSGGTVYGEPSVSVVSETHPTDPICSYGIVKLAVEKYLALYHRLHGLESVSLRISNLYGEHQRPDTGLGVIASFCHKAVTGKTVEIWGDGKVSRDFIYVGDVVDAFAAALDHNGGSLVVNIASGTSVSLNTILETISELIGAEVERRYLPARAFDVQRTCLDVSRAAESLNWRPRTELKEGISRVLGAMQEASKGQSRTGS